MGHEWFQDVVMCSFCYSFVLFLAMLRPSSWLHRRLLWNLTNTLRRSSSPWRHQHRQTCLHVSGGTLITCITWQSGWVVRQQEEPSARLSSARALTMIRSATYTCRGWEFYARLLPGSSLSKIQGHFEFPIKIIFVSIYLIKHNIIGLWELK